MTSKVPHILAEARAKTAWMTADLFCSSSTQKAEWSALAKRSYGVDDLPEEAGERRSKQGRNMPGGSAMEVSR
jgi:hypothetical protein